MKVVLIKDTPNVGSRYEVKEVSPGYAQNFLFPRGFAKTATPALLAHVEEEKKKIEVEKKVQEDLLLKNLEHIAETHITLEEKVNEKGHLFAGLHREAIAKALKTQARLDIHPDFIVLEHPIKEAGEHEIEVTAHGKTAKFKLTISPVK